MQGLFQGEVLPLVDVLVAWNLVAILVLAWFGSISVLIEGDSCPCHSAPSAPSLPPRSLPVVGLSSPLGKAGSGAGDRG